MKQIINGKSYNTETATRIGEYANEGAFRTDFRFFKEELYRKKQASTF